MYSAMIRTNTSSRLNIFHIFCDQLINPLITLHFLFLHIFGECYLLQKLFKPFSSTYKAFIKTVFNSKQEIKMKSLFATLALALIAQASFAGTEITYNGSQKKQRVVYGNISFAEEGIVSADKVCFDANADVFRTHIAAKTVETCSIKELPMPYCKQNGGQVVLKKIAAKDLTAPRTINTQVCDKFDRTDSTYPKCVHYKTVVKAQPVDFEFMKYKVEYSELYPDFRKTYEVFDMQYCN